MIINILSFLISFVFVMLFAPFVFWLVKKIGAKQTILFYVKEHESKQGTPTMGGIMFIVPAIIVSLIFFSKDFTFSII